MEDREIIERAERIRRVFRSEHDRFRFDHPMCTLLCYYGSIARNVLNGHYSRDGLFSYAVSELSDLGFDMSGIDTSRRPEGTSVAEAAENACEDAHDLWLAADAHACAPCGSPLGPAISVVSDADDLMGCLVDDERDVGEWAGCLHRSVSRYLDRIGARGADPSPDPVDHPAHYETGAPFECIDVLVETQGVEAVRHFCLCNAMKYLYRHRRKGGDEDVRKAIWYLEWYASHGESA